MGDGHFVRMGTGLGLALCDVAVGASMFAGVDRDGNQKLDFEEFVAMQPQRIRVTHSDEQMKEWFEAADENGDGTLSINEFFTWSIGRNSKRNGAAILEAIFKKFDRNAGGSLDCHEFKQMAREMCFEQSAAEVFSVLDEDRSGSASLTLGPSTAGSPCRSLLARPLLTQRPVARASRPQQSRTRSCSTRFRRRCPPTSRRRRC
jgi:hypothetical protein